MSIQSEISRISNNVNNSLDALAEQGVTVPANANSNNLPELIRSAGNQFEAALNGKADLSEGVFFIKGASGTAGTWTGTHPDITAYYDGLMIAYKVGVAGASTTTLNINGLGAVTVVRNATTAVSTVYPVNSVVFLVYTVDSGTAYWKAHDYDANTYQRVYESSGDVEYPITTRYNTTDGATYYAEYGRYTNGVTLNPSTNTITASKFKGALVGNADTATKATQDGNGNNIANTYETKEDATRKFSEIGVAPDYIVAEAERVAKAVQAVRTSKTLVFSAMSDPHLCGEGTAETHINSLISAQSGGAGLREIQKRLNLDFCSILGDYSYTPDNYTAEQTMKDIMLARKTIGISDDKQIWCVGNHDWCYGKTADRMLTEDELYAYVGANSDGTKPYASIERCYGYLDFDNQKIRVIFLNTNDCKDGIDNGAITKDNYSYMEMISPTQMRWLADVALDFSDKNDVAEWGVVIISHHPIDYGFNWFKNTLKILEAYREKKSVTLWVADYIKNGNTTGHNETFDFTAVETPADIICNVHGHIHNCASKMVSSQPDSTKTNYVTPWLWRFCIPNMSANRYNEKYNTVWGEVDASGNQVKHEKVMGTAQETSFNIVSVDRKNEKIYAYIFGAGIDRVINYKQAYQPKVYDILVSVSNCSGASDNPSSIVEAGTATLTFTANSGYVLPDSVTVTGATSTWDKASGKLTLSIPTGDVSVSVVAEKNVVNLLDMSKRTYVQYSQANGDPQRIPTTDPHEMDYTKAYASDATARRGYYATARTVYTHNAAENGFTYQVTSNSGYGVEFPVDIVGGKSYVLSFKEAGMSTSVALHRYDSNTHFVDMTNIKTGGGSISGTVSRELTITPQTGYLYSVFFRDTVTNTDHIITDISLTEA